MSLDKNWPTTVNHAQRGGFTAISRALQDLYGFLTAAPISVAVAALTLTHAAHRGRLLVADRAAGITFTLPAATGSGAQFEFFIATTITSNNLVIQVANATDVMAGLCQFAQDSADTMVGFETAATSDTITMNGSTKGGIKGTVIRLRDVASGLFSVEIVGSATGVEATPFSAAV